METPNLESFNQPGTIADQASFDVGLRAHMVRVYNYMASGLALSGIVAFGLVSSADASNATEYTLTGIAAVVLGGTSLAGGRGGLIGPRGRGDGGRGGNQRNRACHHQNPGPGRPLTSLKMSHVGSSVAATDNFRPGLIPDLSFSLT